MSNDVFDAALSQHEAELLADSRAVAAAVYAEVGVIDRLRAAEGREVIIELAGLDVAGTVVECAVDGIVVNGPGTVWIVPQRSVEAVRGLPSGHLPPAGVLQQRSRLAMLIRRHCPIGSPVEVGLTRRQARGSLVRVGSDHVELRGDAGAEVLLLGRVQWLRSQPAPEAG